MPTLKEFARLRPGPVELRGRVVAIDPLVSEETGRRGVYLSFTADRWGQTMQVGPGTGGWFRADAQVTVAPFELSDGETSVLVDPGAARFVAGSHKTRTVILAQPGGDRIRYTESMVEEGDEVVVRGTAAQQGGHDSSTPYRGHTHRWVVTGEADRPMMVASTTPLVKRLTVGLTAVATLAIVAVLAGGIYLLAMS